MSGHSGGYLSSNIAAPILDANATDRLLRFVMAAADMLAEDANARIDRMNTNSIDEAKQ